MLILYLRDNIAFLFGTLPVGAVTAAGGFPVSLSVSSELPGEGPEGARSLVFLIPSLLIQMLLGYGKWSVKTI